MDKQEDYLTNKKGEWVCSECGAVLHPPTDRPVGTILSRLSNTGYVVKNYALYGHLGFRVFCDKTCSAKWFKRNVPNDKRKQSADKTIEEIKKDIPKMSEKLSKRCAAMKDTLEEIRINPDIIRGRSKEEVEEIIRERFSRNYNKR